MAWYQGICTITCLYPALWKRARTAGAASNLLSAPTNMSASLLLDSWKTLFWRGRHRRRYGQQRRSQARTAAQEWCGAGGGCCGIPRRHLNDIDGAKNAGMAGVAVNFGFIDAKVTSWAPTRSCIILTIW